MSRQSIALAGACLASCGLVFCSLNASGQGGKTDSKSDPKPAAAAGDQVVVKRDALRIEPPHKYKVTLSLEPIRSVTLTAPFDGIVRQSDAVPNSKLQPQTEVLRLDTTVAKLNLQRAEAALKIALTEQKLAGDKDELHKTLSQARVDIAKADAELAKHTLDQASIRAPYSCELQRLLVSEGQFVRAGDPLAIVADSTKLRVEVPVERAQAVQGKTLPVKVESAEVDAKIDAVLPLDARFGALRDVFESIASAVLVIDNADGKYKAGQTVYVPLIPRQPVAEVPASSIGNLPDGQRKVQVVRHMVVRDIPVILMGSVGPNRLFVSGTFAEGDEVISESSHQLSDAFVLKFPAAAGSAAASTGTGGSTTPAGTNPGTTTKPVGF
jgi:multidrug efflux pump subunit AcrA (membrane-fusion protein)